MSVTVVLTSCNRPLLLDKTLESFFQFNTYPIEKIIIMDDSGIVGCIDKVINKYKNILVLYNETNIGQIKSIDRAYSHVTTEYIFHCEDDWEFYTLGFIEASLPILLIDQDVVCVWLRQYVNGVITDNGHPVMPDIINHTYRYMDVNFDCGCQNVWGGFTLNPGLRRLKDYNKIKPFSHCVDDLKGHELSISEEYKKLNMVAAITLNESGYVKHIGWGFGIRN